MPILKRSKTETALVSFQGASGARPRRARAGLGRPPLAPSQAAPAAPLSAFVRMGYAYADNGGQLHERLRSPHTLSTRPTGTQYFARFNAGTG
jgi:hypothetical protein